MTGTLSAGDVVGGRYRVEALAGSGGYARVYRAHDEHLDRRVALKVFSTVAADRADADRIASETRLLASVTHPSLVTLFDAQLDTDPSFLAMEFIDGPTLRERLASGPLDPRSAARLAAELAEALHVIHARGIVHRDMKPSNVLLRRSSLPDAPPRATLADFGIAYLVDSSRITAAGTLVGTAAYLSPEQARGDAPGPPTDIYALGLVLLEALTGRRAYAQSTPQEALLARLARSPEIPAGLPADWRTLLSAMTAMEASHRPDAHAVLRAVDRLHGAPSADRTAVAAEDAASLATGAPTLPLEASRPADTAITELEQAPTAAAGAERPRRARPVLMWSAAIGALVLVSVVAFVVVTSLGGPAPAPSPTLPALPEPLGEHLRQLLEQVNG